MIQITDLPHVNAAFNSAAAVCLCVGYVLIRQGRRQAHMKAMVSALAFSGAFLVTYLIYHFNAGLAKFGGEGLIRPIYFTILIVHVIGAIAITPLVPMVVWRAATGRFERHKPLARVTLPLWLFVAVSGVVVYVMAIHLYPSVHA